METARTDDDDVCEVYEVALDSFQYTRLRKPRSRPLHHGITNVRTPMWAVIVENTMFCFVWETEPCQLQVHHSVEEITGVRCEVLNHLEILRRYNECKKSRQGLLGVTRLSFEEIEEKGKYSRQI